MESKFNSQGETYFNESGNEQGSVVDIDDTNFEREVIHDDAEMDDVVRGLGTLDDDWQEEEGDDEVYDHGGINPYYGFWDPYPVGHD